MPAKPTNASAAALTASSVRVTWSAAAHGAAGYRIYRTTPDFDNADFSTEFALTGPDYIQDDFDFRDFDTGGDQGEFGYHNLDFGPDFHSPAGGLSHGFSPGFSKARWMLVGKVGANTLQFDDTGLDPETRYVYHVRTEGGIEAVAEVSATVSVV